VNPTPSFAFADGTVSFRADACSDVGCVRAINEDSCLAEAPAFVVADGMGGHEHGERASQTAVNVLRQELVTGRVPTAGEVLEAVALANDAVRALVNDEGEQLVSGTTLAGLVLVGDEQGMATHWMTVNVGDSRLYSWSASGLEQLTVDHSAVQELLDAGTISAEAARVHPERNVVTRAIGAGDAVTPDVWLTPLRASETFLLCTDGVTKELDDEAIALVLAAGHESPASAIVAAANAAGGRDNITAVVVMATLVAPDGSTLVHNDRVEGIDHNTTTRTT
jgi:serine/threonine protein phosphatase PrpC